MIPAPACTPTRNSPTVPPARRSGSAAGSRSTRGTTSRRVRPHREVRLARVRRGTGRLIWPWIRAILEGMFQARCWTSRSFAPTRGDHDDASAFLELVGSLGDGRAAGDRRRAGRGGRRGRRRRCGRGGEGRRVAQGDDPRREDRPDDPGRPQGGQGQGRRREVRPRLDPQRRRFRPRRHHRAGLGEDPRRAPVVGAQEPPQDPDHLRDRRGARAQQRGRGRDLPAQHRPGGDARPGLVEKAARITALELAGTGIRWAFAPCVAVARDERWGRTYESFGEDPELAEVAGRRGGPRAPGLQPRRRHVGPRLRQALPRRRRNDRRRRPGQYRVRRGHAPEAPPAGLHRRHQGRRRVGHGLVQPLERHARCTPTSTS